MECAALRERPSPVLSNASPAAAQGTEKCTRCRAQSKSPEARWATRSLVGAPSNGMRANHQDQSDDFDADAGQHKRRS